MLRPNRRMWVVAAATGIAVMMVAGAALVAPRLRPVSGPLSLALDRVSAVGGAHGAVGVTGRLARVVLGPVARAVDGVVVNEVEAQTRLDFKPVPEESAKAFDRGTASGRAGRHPSAGVPATPAPPAAPAEPVQTHQPPDNSTPEPPEPPTPSSTGNIVQIGTDIHIEKGQVVDGDVLSINSDIRVDGHVRGNVSATRGDVYLGPTARVDRDVLCIGGTLHEEPGAFVGGQRVTGLEGRDRVRGRLRDRIEREIDESSDAARHARRTARSLIYLLLWLGIAWLVTHFAPTRTATALKSLQTEPGLALGWGFLLIVMLIPSVVALAFVVALLCITIVGIPVALGALLAYAALLVILGGWGAVVGYAALGQRFANRSGQGAPSLTRAALIGVAIIIGLPVLGHLFHLMPFMGAFGTLLFVLGIVGDAVVVLLGMGALLRSKFGQGPQGVWWPPQHLFRSLDAGATTATPGWWAPGGSPAPAPMAPPPVAPPPAAPAPPVAPPPAPPEAGPLSASTPSDPPPSQP